MPQPDQSQMPQLASHVLSDEELLEREQRIDAQRKEAAGLPPSSVAELERMHKFNPANMNLDQPNEAPSEQACPYCNGPMSLREASEGICGNCAGHAGLPSNSLTGETVSPSYM